MTDHDSSIQNSHTIYMYSSAIYRHHITI